MDNGKQLLLEVYLKEYDKLKTEQTARIGFRDNLLYVTLGLFGAVFSFAFSQTTHYYALLVLPWICLILGWTYLVNDEKISALGKYIRKNLAEIVKNQPGIADVESIFGWEIVHRSDERRKRRKIEQLVIDEITFVFSGTASIAAFWLLVPQAHLLIQLLSWVELGLLVILGVEMVIYADLAKGP